MNRIINSLSPFALILMGFSIRAIWAREEGGTGPVGSSKDEEIKMMKTGSWRNCSAEGQMKEEEEQRNEMALNNSHHPHSSHVTVSCNNIHYRIPPQSLTRLSTTSTSTIRRNNKIVIGVLSGAGIPERRRNIRSTWGYAKYNIFFIVGGPWNDIQEEYDTYGDILWMDREEIYITETSVLTLKTEAFLSIMYERLMGSSTSTQSQVEYLFKTDDDSYVDLELLYNTLLPDDNEQGKGDTTDSSTVDYWGKCNEGGWKPHRNQEIEWQKKWYISYETYAEPEYPPFCQGAGYALSKKFLDCAVGEKHIANVKYMPNEDVAVGMLAERCNVTPMNDDRVWIRWEGPITMEGKIVQHYVKTEEDMRLHHQSVTGVKGPILL